MARLSRPRVLRGLATETAGRALQSGIRAQGRIPERDHRHVGGVRRRVRRSRHPRIGRQSPHGASHELRKEAGREFESQKLNVLSIIESVGMSDDFLKRLAGDLNKLRILGGSDVVKAWRPGGQFVSRDMLALGQGLWIPPHVSVLAKVIATRQALGSVEKLAKLARQLAAIFERRLADTKDPAAQPEGWVFRRRRAGRATSSASDISTTISPRPPARGSGSTACATPSSPWRNVS